MKVKAKKVLKNTTILCISINFKNFRNETRENKRYKEESYNEEKKTEPEKIKEKLPSLDIAINNQNVIFC
jgi:hypothetical protein